MSNWDLVVKMLAEPKPNTGAAYFQMALNALVYLSPSDWQPQLVTWLGSAGSTYFPVSGQFGSAAVVVSDGTNAAVAWQGTRTFQQWFTYVAGAAPVPWPRNRGNVFSPFAQIQAQNFGPVQGALSNATMLYLTGHSLGAAVAALSTTALVDLGYQCPLQYFFAFPAVGDFTFRRTYTTRAFTFNHPLDPVPLVPPDPYTLSLVSPYLAFRGYGWFSVGAQAWPFEAGAPSSPRSGLLWPGALIASSFNFNTSPHNTYVYLRAIGANLGNAGSLFYAPLTALLKDLGLLDPWPA